MRTTITAVAAVLIGTGSVAAQDAPRFFTESLPAQSVGPILQGYGALKGEDAALDEKTLELIAVAVAAQIPCQYCLYAHRKNARNAGATDAELREAVAMGGMIRPFSTALYGAGYDFETFKTEHDAIAPPTN